MKAVSDRDEAASSQSSCDRAVTVVQSLKPVSLRRSTISARNALRPIEVLFVGDAKHIEFQPTLGVLQHAALVSFAGTIEDAAQRMAGWSPELIIVGQTRPDELTEHSIAALQAASPASRFVLLEGSCCEGEGRSGPQRHGQWRLYWHQAPALLQAGLRRRQSGQSAWWNAEPEQVRLAPAQTRGLVVGQERCFKNLDLKPDRAGIGVVCSRDPDFAEVLADILRDLSLQPLTISLADAQSACDESVFRMQGVSVVLWDCDSGEDLELQSDAQSIRDRQIHGDRLPILALVGALRAEDFCRWKQCSQVRVLNKPFDMASLYGQLAEMLHTAELVSA